MPLNTTSELLSDLKKGKMVVLMDDEDRENEGDLILPAGNVSPEAINFPENIINPAIINPVNVSIMGVALIMIVAIFIFFSTTSVITLLAFSFSASSF